MSYAEMAAKGPKQSDAEKYGTMRKKMAPPMPEVVHTEDHSVHSLDTISSSSSVNSIPSYADQQLESERAEQARQEGERFADEAAIHAREFEQMAEAELSRLEQESGSRFSEFNTDAKSKYESWKKSAEREFRDLKKKAGREGKQAKEKARDAEKWADKNKDNPVVVGNAVTFTAIAALLGFGAYRLHQQGNLTARVVGLWAGGLGLFAVGDYYLSNFLFKKYPTKK